MNKFFCERQSTIRVLRRCERQRTCKWRLPYNDWYFADMAKQGVDVTGAPRKRESELLLWDYGSRAQVTRTTSLWQRSY